MKYAIGFDLSLTAPAAVALPLDWRPGDWQRVRFWLLKPPAPKSDDVAGQLVRYAAISQWVLNCYAAVGRPKQYAVEAYAFSKNNASASKLMELGGIVRMNLYYGCLESPLPVVVAASSARKTLLGKVPRSDQKLAVQVALYNVGAPLDPKLVEGRVKRPKHATSGTYEENVCDALVIANHFLSELGGRFLTVGGRS